MKMAAFCAHCIENDAVKVVGGFALCKRCSGFFPPMPVPGARSSNAVRVRLSAIVKVYPLPPAYGATSVGTRGSADQQERSARGYRERALLWVRK